MTSIQNSGLAVFPIIIAAILAPCEGNPPKSADGRLSEDVYNYCMGSLNNYKCVCVRLVQLSVCSAIAQVAHTYNKHFWLTSSPSCSSTNACTRLLVLVPTRVRRYAELFFVGLAGFGTLIGVWLTVDDWTNRNSVLHKSHVTRGDPVPTKPSAAALYEDDVADAREDKPLLSVQKE